MTNRSHGTKSLVHASPDPARDEAPGGNAPDEATRNENAQDRALQENMVAAFLDGQYKQSSLMAFHVTKQNPEVLVAWMILVECQMQKGDVSRALMSIKSALRLFPDHFELMRLRGEVFLALDREDLAENAFRACLRRDPNNVIALRRLRARLRDSGRSDAALSCLIDPNQDDETAIAAWRMDAVRLWAAQDATTITGEEECQRAIACAPAFGEAYEALGERVGANENAQKAVELFGRSIHLNPERVYARQLSALYLADQGRIREAMTLARAAIALQPDDEIGYFVMVYLNFFSLRIDDAASIHKRGIALNPDHPAALVSLSEWRDQGGRADFRWFFSD